MSFSDSTAALVSMAQTLAASRHGAPLGIPLSVIAVAVHACGKLLGSSQADMFSATDEILRRTVNTRAA